MRKSTSRYRSDHLEIAMLRALHKARRATRNRPTRQVRRTTPPRPHNTMHVHMTASTELVVTALATNRRKLPRLQSVSDQHHTRDITLAAHRQIGTAPRKASRVVAAPQVQKAAAHSRQHNLEIPLRAAEPLDEQTTTPGHNPSSSHAATLTVPPARASANRASIPSDPQ
jgi:hypothetical protein